MTGMMAAELVFFTGPMDCGKSTLALQFAYTQSAHGRHGRLYTNQDRSGHAVISSRLGLARPAIEVNPSLDVWRDVATEIERGRLVDFIVCDEAQFYSVSQIDQIARLVDDLQVDAYCFGILADFRSELFPGSKRLVELADRMETLQVHPLCWCGARATHNARVIGGLMVTEGSQVAIGDVDGGASTVHYEVLCRRHHRLRMIKTQQDVGPDLLPFDDDWRDT